MTSGSFEIISKFCPAVTLLQCMIYAFYRRDYLSTAVDIDRTLIKISWTMSILFVGSQGQWVNTSYFSVTV
jgi:hypothetical protein